MRLIFTDDDRIKLGNIAEGARVMLQQSTFTRAEYDTWHAEFLAIRPMLEMDDGTQQPFNPDINTPETITWLWPETTRTIS